MRFVGFCVLVLWLVSSIEAAQPRTTSGVVDVRWSDSALSYIGRWMADDSGDALLCDWSQCAFSVSISGASSVSLLMADHDNYFNVYIDGVVSQVLVTNETDGVIIPYNILWPSDGAAHELLVMKRTEASLGVLSFAGVEFVPLGDYTIEPVPRSKERTIEAIGDSLTCGYGILGASPDCDWSDDTEDATLAYESLIAETFDAVLYTEAWSGKGMVRNYGDPNITSSEPFPSLYPRTLGNSEEFMWDFSLYSPDVVILNLGTNDYSTEPYPPLSVFESGYVDFLTDLRKWYPNAAIFCICGPVTNQHCCLGVKESVNQMGGEPQKFYYINMLNILTWPVDYGCDAHPNTSGHQKMAQVVIPVISDVMGW
ncbi:esterase, SGNH hydrolase-type [Pelomyxa schiedti]|nr:esterase, SGNH hydrolase-type [Pelomyxa schiedti]